MISKGIRGAITVEKNNETSIKEATIELLTGIVKANKIETSSISHVIFTMTEDLNASFPAKHARLNCGWKDVAMMCFNELNVSHSLKKCLRVLIVVNVSENFIPEFIYLKGASQLRG